MRQAKQAKQKRFEGKKTAIKKQNKKYKCDGETELFFPMIKLNCIFQEAVDWPFPQVAFFSYQPTSAALHHII